MCAEATPTLSITVEDNGVGAAYGAAAGRGEGLALHTAMLAVIGGTLTLESAAGAFTRVTIHPPAQTNAFG